MQQSIAINIIFINSSASSCVCVHLTHSAQKLTFPMQTNQLISQYFISITIPFVSFLCFKIRSLSNAIFQLKMVWLSLRKVINRFQNIALSFISEDIILSPFPFMLAGPHGTYQFIFHLWHKVLFHSPRCLLWGAQQTYTTKCNALKSFSVLKLRPLSDRIFRESDEDQIEKLRVPR